jgi:EAL domain-containing protein (putative c-di-GMP-specific phosphodiesterase class I)
VFAEPFQLGDAEAKVTASVGLALGGAATSVHDLLREAEIALHQAKLDATRHTVLFDPTMRAQTLERVDLELDLRRAIDRDELRLHYQPLIDLRTDRVVGTEALVRWQHPARGLVPPLAFVPLAEETGLILPIGRWVLETACAQLLAWQREQADGAPIVMSVNLSARQFSQAGLVDEVAALLATSGLPPRTLELEITESVVLDETEAGIARLHALRELGVRLVLDDFGTGYSSLSYLRRLPLDAIKIDRSFVMGLGTGEADDRSSDLPIVQAVIALAHALGIEVVAEGIETPEQLRLLRTLGCDRGQGFLFARPLVPADAARMLGRRPVRSRAGPS